MTRKNIFQLVEESYNIQNEIKKINRLFFEEKYFSSVPCFDYTIVDVLDEYLFVGWKYRGTCLTIKGFLQRANAFIDYKTKSNASEETIINNIEAIENFIKLYLDNAHILNARDEIECDYSFNHIFYPLIETLEKRMGLVKKRI